MALIDEDTRCAICGQVLGEGERLCTTFFGIEHPDFRLLDDGCAHQDCLRGWPRRDEFVSQWNARVRTTSIWGHLLRVSRDGTVRYATTWEECLIRIGLK